MTVAAIYDIHGNLPALEAVLQEIDKAQVDQIIVGGDVIPGPMPYKTLQRLREIEIPIHFIEGNGETSVLDHINGTSPDSVPDRLREIVSWVAEQLPSDYIEFVSTWVKTITLEISGLGKVLFCHGTPRNNTDIFTYQTPEQRLVPIFENTDAPIVICGHTHMQFDRKIGQTRVINAGSVGMSFGGSGAYWLLLDSDIEFKNTEYDVSQAAGLIRQSGYPQAADFADNNVLQTPSEADTLAMLAKSEL